MANDNIYKGIAYACTAFFAFTAAGAINKLLMDYHTPIETVFYRNALCLVPSFLYIVATRHYDLLRTHMPVTLSVRALVGTLAFILTFAAMQELPLADATVMFFLSTLLTPVFAHFFLKELIGLHRWIAVFIGMSGVLLVAQPGGHVTTLGVAFALGAAVGHAAIQVLIRAMKTEHPFTITFYFFLAGTLIPALALPWVGHMPLLEHVPLLLLLGLCGWIGQYCLTRGFQLAPASLLSPFSYTGLLWATGFDILLWSYVPGWIVFLGGAIIIASGLYIIHRERQVAMKP